MLTVGSFALSLGVLGCLVVFSACRTAGWFGSRHPRAWYWASGEGRGLGIDWGVGGEAGGGVHLGRSGAVGFVRSSRVMARRPRAWWGAWGARLCGWGSLPVGGVGDVAGLLVSLGALMLGWGAGCTAGCHVAVPSQAITVC
jgi:hypothetical protein